MELEVGAVLEGKVTGIMKFGAFVSLGDNKSGLVHISEIANTYVSEVSQFLTAGQEVKVKVMSIGDDGKINLSIKKAEPPKQQEAQRPQRSFQQSRPAPRGNFTPRPQMQKAEPKPEASFEDKLKQFMQDSDSRMNGNKLYDRKNSGRKRRD